MCRQGPFTRFIYWIGGGLGRLPTDALPEGKRKKIANNPLNPIHLSRKMGSQGDEKSFVEKICLSPKIHTDNRKIYSLY